MIGVAAIACSVSLNAMFFGHLGRTRHEAIVFASVAAVVDLAKGILPVLIATLRGPGAGLWKTGGVAAFAVFTLASFVATLGFFAINRAAVTGEQTARGTFFHSWQRELGEIEREYYAIDEHRSVAELDAAIEAALAALFALVVELSSGLLLGLGVLGIEQRRMRRNKIATPVEDDASGKDAPADVSFVPFDTVQDALHAYVRERIVVDPGAETSASTLFHDALAWFTARSADATQLTPARLGRFLQHDQFFVADKRGGRMFYRGVRLRDAGVDGPDV